jgi:hypothetical protein
MPNFCDPDLQFLRVALSKMPLPKSCHPERSVDLAALSGPIRAMFFGVNGQSSQIGPEGSAPLPPWDLEISFAPADAYCHDDFVVGLSFSDAPDVGDYLNFTCPRPHFQPFVANKPKPKPKSKPNRQRVATCEKPRGARIAAPQTVILNERCNRE